MDRTNRARQLRQRSTDAERALWKVLRNRQLGGFKFRRQEWVGLYVADFVCMERRLIVELDGGHHDQQRLRDAMRSRDLEDDGFTVIRFWNNEVLTNLESVADAILIELRRPSP